MGTPQGWKKASDGVPARTAAQAFEFRPAPPARWFPGLAAGRRGGARKVCCVAINSNGWTARFQTNKVDMVTSLKEQPLKRQPVYRNIHITQLTSYRLPPAGWVSILHRISGAAMFLLLPFAIWMFDT